MVFLVLASVPFRALCCRSSILAMRLPKSSDFRGLRFSRVSMNVFGNLQAEGGQEEGKGVDARTKWKRLRSFCPRWRSSSNRPNMQHCRPCCVPHVHARFVSGIVKPRHKLFGREDRIYDRVLLNCGCLRGSSHMLRALHAIAGGFSSQFGCIHLAKQAKNWLKECETVALCRQDE